MTEAKDFWIVLFTDGFECAACGTAKKNILRLSAGLSHVAKVPCRLVVCSSSSSSSSAPPCLVLRCAACFLLRAHPLFTRHLVFTATALAFRQSPAAAAAAAAAALPRCQRIACLPAQPAHLPTCA